ncbi:MAG: DsrE/DsrF/DrsH-like family protein [Comamonadaceae bacterium]|nr:DsrE/DsrF/DrsH-like family protein [Comamonadaceae bacterium]
MEQKPIDFAIIMTSGPDTPKRLAAPFFLAATAAAEDMNVVVYFTGLGTLLLKKGVAEQLYPKEGGKSVRYFMDQALNNGARFVACVASMDLNDIRKEDLGFELPMVGVAESLPYLGSANKLVSF